MYKKFNDLKKSIFISSNRLISTHSQFNVFSGGLTECLVEPWHVGMSTVKSEVFEKSASEDDNIELGRINITDSPDLIRKKICKAVTGSVSKIEYDPKNRPGI